MRHDSDKAARRAFGARRTELPGTQRSASAARAESWRGLPGGGEASNALIQRPSDVSGDDGVGPKSRPLKDRQKHPRENFVLFEPKVGWQASGTTPKRKVPAGCCTKILVMQFLAISSDKSTLCIHRTQSRERRVCAHGQWPLARRTMFTHRLCPL